MAKNDVIDTSELQRLMKRMSRVQAEKVIKNDVVDGAHLIVKEAGEYPPINNAGKDRWYDRGYGPRWRRADGSVGGKKTSEQLLQQWFVRSQSSGVLIANPVSYAGWVHGAKQARIHTRRGWKKLKKVAQDEVNKITKRVAKKMGRELTRG